MKKCYCMLAVLLCIQLSVLAQSTDYPVFSAQGLPPPGLYLTSDDYLNLRPADTEIVFQHIPQMQGDGINNFYRKQPGGRKRDMVSPKNYFAASDGKTFYISWAGKWHKAKKIDSGYSFIALVSRMTKEQADRARVRAMSSAGAGRTDVLIPAEYMQDPYRMKFSLQERTWIAVEHVGKGGK